jgi:hypothetical protein
MFKTTPLGVVGRPNGGFSILKRGFDSLHPLIFIISSENRGFCEFHRSQGLVLRIKVRINGSRIPVFEKGRVSDSWMGEKAGFWTMFLKSHLL